MSDAPRISVLIPVWNADRWLAAALDSVLAQTFSDFELLVHDDGSTDGSLAILQEYAARDSRVVVTSEPNKGIVETLNGLLATAQGDLVARMDADDICLPERFAKQVAFLDAHPEVGVLGTFVDGIDADDRPLRPFTAASDHESIDRHHIESVAVSLWHPSIMMRRKILDQLGGYSDRYTTVEDYDLWLRMGEVTRLANLPETLLLYRLHLSSISATRRAQQDREGYQALRAARIRRGLPVTGIAPPPLHTPGEVEIMQKWARWAIAAGNHRTALTYTAAVLRRAPVSRSNLHLLYSLLRSWLFPGDRR